jgi:RNA polymerase sigma factor (sigma-70 family)
VASLSDETLLAGLAAGDEDALTALMRRYQARVYGLVTTILDDRGTAEEVAQETFVRAWRYAGSYDARRGRVSSWLLTIARNLAVDRIRPKRAEPVDPELLERKLERAAGDVKPADEAMPPDERERIRAAVAELPLEQRRAIFLARYMGRTAREISEVEQAPLGTIKARIRTAMLKLHDVLESPNEV